MADPVTLSLILGGSGVVLAPILAGAAVPFIALGLKVSEKLVKHAWKKLRHPKRLPPHIEHIEATVARAGPHTPPAAAKQMSQAELIAQARTNLGIDCLDKYNFAVCGLTGVGKSSLVNALRGLHNYDKGAAPTGLVEKTTKVASYPHPELDHIVFWDVPGAGTTASPARNYFLDKCLYAFDCLIVMFAGRSYEIDMDIATRACDWGVPVLFVRHEFDKDAADYVGDLDPSDRPKNEEDLKRMLVELRERLVTDARNRLQRKDPRLGKCNVYAVSSRAYLDGHGIHADEMLLANELVRLASLRV